MKGPRRVAVLFFHFPSLVLIFFPSYSTFFLFFSLSLSLSSPQCVSLSPFPLRLSLVHGQHNLPLYFDSWLQLFLGVHCSRGTQVFSGHTRTDTQLCYTHTNGCTDARTHTHTHYFQQPLSQLLAGYTSRFGWK